jgi:hypothetical protein
MIGFSDRTTFKKCSKSRFGPWVDTMGSCWASKMKNRKSPCESNFLTKYCLYIHTYMDELPSYSLVDLPCICKKNANRHTFGADKDRFKNSIFGRLDLAAKIPG